MRGLSIPRRALSRSQEEAMLALLVRHFEGVEPAQFRRDLAEKDWVVVLIDRAGSLIGFSTLAFERLTLDGEPLTAVYSGDTIVAPEGRSSPLLFRTWIDAVLRVHGGWGRIQWLLLTSGFRTYRFLPTFWREFFPRFDRETPGAVRERLGALAGRRYGSVFDARAGIVRFEKPQVLRAPQAEVSAARARDPHVAFFLAANPGHSRGDELVCLTEICPENLTAAGKRMTSARSLQGLAP